MGSAAYWACDETQNCARHRQDAARLQLPSRRADGPRLRAGFRAGADTGGHAAIRRVRRQIHDRLPKGIPQKLVCARKALTGTPRSFPELLRRWREPAALRVAQEGLVAPGRPAWLVPVVLPLLHGSPNAG